MSTEPTLRVDDVEVRFGGLTALSHVSLHAMPGHVTGLIGPNGAGKTTLFNVITGLQPPTAGRIWIDGAEASALKPHQRARLAVARTFQRLEVFGSLTARENILVACEARTKWIGRRPAGLDAMADAILERVGLAHVANETVDTMPTGLARMVELGRAMATRPRLLLLDEPGSGLDHHESEVLGDLIVGLAREGMAVLLVEHDVDLVMRVCDQIFVLDFGVLIASGAPAEIQADRRVQAAYLGAEVPA